MIYLYSHSSCFSALSSCSNNAILSFLYFNLKSKSFISNLIISNKVRSLKFSKFLKKIDFSLTTKSFEFWVWINLIDPPVHLTRSFIGILKNWPIKSNLYWVNCIGSPIISLTQFNYLFTGLTRRVELDPITLFFMKILVYSWYIFIRVL